MNNFEWLHSLSVEEFGAWLEERIMSCPKYEDSEECDRLTCETCWANWLRKLHKEEEE